MTPEPLYLEDLRVGQRFVSGEYRMHLDRDEIIRGGIRSAALSSGRRGRRKSIFRGLAASGWHTAAVTMRLMVTGGMPLANGIVGLGGDIAWPKPTRPGDVLHVESEILEIIPFPLETRAGDRPGEKCHVQSGGRRSLCLHRESFTVRETSKGDVPCRMKAP